ncbi:DUF3052 family protein [Pelomonas sp. V22]|uniref:DUF3052 family protein n=1 Tax=Pelomonas sp. V22 TaxID=2822139 RepID=UPI0024A9A3EE|nr:DUF3052 family protein [Pelomonas sp. V22]
MATTTTAAGYSGTPLAKKLGLKEGSQVLALHPPAGLAALKDLLAPLPPQVVFQKTADTSTDLVLLFVTERSVLAAALDQLPTQLRPDAAIWVSWPKKASRLPTDITEDVIREIALPLGLVDIKVCAVDATWSGLKLVRRKALR